jgi:UDP-N-acetylmuramoyl-tripeptide--D-alanyl-D-alanine ligase
MADPRGLWTSRDAQRATAGVLEGGGWNVQDISIDTRTIKRGDLFLPLVAERDGHDFIPMAFERGAEAAICARKDIVAKGPLLRVNDTLEALRGLGEAARSRAKHRVAVTGSVGKTSTKEAMARALALAGPTHAAVKSFNNHWGLPLTLARTPTDTRFGVYEIGMNHRGEILPLARQVAPTLAVVTMIAPAHIEALGSLEMIAMEKGDIFFGLEQRGTAVFNLDAPHSNILRRQAEDAKSSRIVSYSAEGRPDADLRIIERTRTSDGTSLVVDAFGERLSFRIPVPGVTWETNGLAVLAVAHLSGAGLATGVRGLEALEAVEGRGATKVIALVDGGSITLVDEAYNANPASMRAAFETHANRAVGPGGRRIVALGDMLELGPGSRAYHAGLAEDLVRLGIDAVYCAGPQMAALWEALPDHMRAGFAQTAEALSPQVADGVRSGDVVMVKGSNGSRMRLVVAALGNLQTGGENGNAL